MACADASPLHSVDARPGWHQRQDSGHQVHQIAGRVALVAAGLPQLVQAGAADDQRRVQLQPVRPERRVLEKLLRETQPMRAGRALLRPPDICWAELCETSKRWDKSDTQAYRMWQKGNLGLIIALRIETFQSIGPLRWYAAGSALS